MKLINTKQAASVIMCLSSSCECLHSIFMKTMAGLPLNIRKDFSMLFAVRAKIIAVASICVYCAHSHAAIISRVHAVETNTLAFAAQYNPEATSVMVPVTLYDQKVPFVVDTGAGLTMLDATYKTRLGTPIDSGLLLAASGNLSALLYESPKLFLGNINCGLQRVGCIDLRFLQSIAGTDFMGVLGVDVLKDYVVTFDTDAGRFSLATNLSEIIRTNAMAVPLSAGQQKSELCFTGTVNGLVPITLHIDSGYNKFLSLNPTDWEKILVTHPTSVRSGLMAGIDGVPITTQSARISQLTIGTNTYTNVIATLRLNSSAPSYVGVGYLRQHIATIDFPNQVLYLQRSKHFNESMESDMSGLALIKSDNKVIVFGVDKDSPSYEAGIRAGEELVTINGQKASAMAMEPLRGMLMSGSGIPVTLQLKQAENLTNVVIRLRRLL